MGLGSFLFIVLIVSSTFNVSTPTLLYGCIYEASLCDPEETCVEVSDGMFGRCQTAPFDPTTYNKLNELELELLSLELTRLVGLGLKWHSAETQCVLSYFFMTRKEHIRFDPEFCNVRNPANILALIQLAEYAADESANVDDDVSYDVPVYADPDYDRIIPPFEPDYDYYNGNTLGDGSVGESEDHPSFEIPDLNEDAAPEKVGSTEWNNKLLTNVVDQLIQPMSQRDERGINDQQSSMDADDSLGKGEGQISTRQEEDYRLTLDEEKTLNEMLLKVMSGKTPDLSRLSNEQLDKFIGYVELMQSLLELKEDGNTIGEVAMPEQRYDPEAERSLLKKDEEEIGNLDLGLENREHKIVKGERHSAPIRHSIEKVEGNRVHIQTAKDLTKDTGRLIELVDHLKEKIATPKNLSFSDFKLNSNEISFKVSSKMGEGEKLSPKWLRKIFGVVSPSPKRIFPEGLEAAAAIAKDKRKMDKLVGENQVFIGTASKRGAVFKKTEDAFVVPTLVISGLIVGVLVALLGVYIYRNRSRARSTLKRLAADLEGQPTKAYEELCRQRMAGKGEGPEPLGTVINTFTQRLGSQSESPTAGGIKGTSPRTSSTSSWSEEPVHITNMDISTGHMILSYLEDHLRNKDKLEEDWTAVSSYRPDLCETLVATLKDNQDKNRSQHALPYDHARIQLLSEAGESPSEYINASPLYDHDPSNPVYISTQGPLAQIVSDFWQMIWEQGSVVIVNLTKIVEDGQNVCHRYWPENGSEVYGVFEVHLVSEHIWCEDYLVRSFYLKNLRTNETRTVTQFHFLSWREGGVPSSPKPLLEFRRKVNKSYRGRSCPIVVHCSDGAGRTGTYCLLDMALNRINKGVKEIDIAATLEHLRDQRMNLVGCKAQYEFVLTCVAEEVEAVIKALPQQ